MIERARSRPVPTIHLGEPRGLDDVYWQFYVIEHDCQDLLTRTVLGFPGHELDPDRIRGLRSGSIVIASPKADTSIDQMVAAGELKRIGVGRAPDGTPISWILERAGS